MFNLNKGAFVSSAIEKSEEGNNFRVSIYKNIKGGSDIKEAVLVTVESIESEIAKLDTQIDKLQTQKEEKQAELEEIS